MIVSAERPIVFDCQGDRLVGIVHEPEVPPTVGLVFVVGGPQFRVGAHRQFVHMARRFAASGFAVLRFDYRGMGDSDGEPRSFETVDDDIESAVRALRRQCQSIENVVLIGLCDAASAILMYCANGASTSGLILMNPWVRTEASAAEAEIRNYYGRRIFQLSFCSRLAP